MCQNYKEGLKPITEHKLKAMSGDFVTMVDNSLHSMFQQVDVSFNQSLTNYKSGMLLSLKKYFNTLLENTINESKGKYRVNCLKKILTFPNRSNLIGLLVC